MLWVIAYMNLKKYLKKEPLILIGVAICVALVVFLVLLYANLGFLISVGYFEKNDPYKNSIVIFFHDDCSYCDNVDTYLKNNNVASKVSFAQLNVENEYNRSELADKVQICGLDIDNVGVPFLWDGVNKKCVIGYIDIIAFFKQKMVKK